MLTNYGLEKMTAVGERIRSSVKNGPGTLIIADVGVNEESYAPVFEALEYAQKQGWKSIWLDHHVWPSGPRQEIQKVCELVLYSEKDGVKKCAAELCHERFAPENALASQLAAIAHRTDFPDSAKFPIPPLTALISYYLGFPELRDRLLSVILENVTKGVLWESKMQADVMEGFKLIEASMERSMKGLVSKEFSYAGREPGVRVAVAKSDAFVSRSVLLGRIMDESAIDIAIAYTEDGKVSIRKKDTCPAEIDCSRIALEFKEGGGHVGAAGGFLKTDPLGEGDGAAIQEITDALKSYLSKPT
jgi:oligoribonuclease NrnB/cAMP/cGMP phosphodiesterase (DHH superfamily)